MKISSISGTLKYFSWNCGGFLPQNSYKPFKDLIEGPYYFSARILNRMMSVLMSIWILLSIWPYWLLMFNLWCHVPNIDAVCTNFNISNAADKLYKQCAITNFNVNIPEWLAWCFILFFLFFFTNTNIIDTRILIIVCSFLYYSMWFYNWTK